MVRTITTEKGGIMHAMKQRIMLTAAVLGLCVAWAQGAEAVPMAHLVLDSERGDFVGGALTAGGPRHSDVTYTPASSSLFSAAIVASRNVAGQPAYLQFFFLLPTNPDEYTTLDFATDQLGIPFATGVYTDAQRAFFASAGHPGLDVSFEHRGSNTLTGTFTVNSVSFFTDAGGLEIGGLDVNFEQHSEGGLPALLGHFTFTADVAAAPEPGTYALMLTGLGLLGFATRRISGKTPRRPVRSPTTR
jgi:hypothetical protein